MFDTNLSTENVLTFFRQAESRFLGTLYDEKDRSDFEREYLAASQAAKSFFDSGHFCKDAVSFINLTASRIKLIAQETFHLESCAIEMCNDSVIRARELFACSRNAKPSASGKDSNLTTHRASIVDKTEENSFSELLNAKVLRRWMLDNIAFPYPTREEKENLARHTNIQLGVPSSLSLVESTDIGLSGTPITSDQCALWFTNGRRRSRWQEFNRTYGLNLRGRMEHIVEVIREHNEVPGNADDHSTPCPALEDILKKDVKGGVVNKSKGDIAKMSSECRKLFAHVIAWVSQSTKERVGPWVEDVIKEVVADEKQRKKQRRAERRRLREEQEKIQHEKQTVELGRGARRLRRSSRSVAPYSMATRRRPIKTTGRPSTTRQNVTENRLDAPVRTPSPSLLYTNSNVVTPQSRKFSGKSQASSDWSGASFDSMPSLISDCSSSFSSSFDSSVPSPTLSHSNIRPIAPLYRSSATLASPTPTRQQQSTTARGQSTTLPGRSRGSSTDSDYEMMGEGEQQHLPASPLNGHLHGRQMTFGALGFGASPFDAPHSRQGQIEWHRNGRSDFAPATTAARSHSSSFSSSSSSSTTD